MPEQSAITHTSYKFRAYPSPEQVATIMSWQDAQRALWNAANAQRLERLRRPGYDTLRPTRHLRAFDQHNELTAYREEFEWRRAIPQAFQQDLLMRLGRSWDAAFDQRKNTPAFKSKAKNDWAPLSAPAVAFRRISRKRVRPPKLGDIRIRGHRPIRGKPATIAITRDGDQWFVVITCKADTCPPSQEAASGQPIGIDVGVNNVIADSAGRLVPGDLFPQSHSKAIVRMQRLMRRREQPKALGPTQNYTKSRIRFAKLHRKNRRSRLNLLHTISSRYAKSHSVVAVEDLAVRNMSVRNMSKSVSGTRDNPGKGVAQKRGLNRVVVNAGWYELRRQLDYKCRRAGTKLLVVLPHFTSQTCNACGCVDRRSRRTQVLFMCTECGFIDHADVNAARNILTRAIGTTGATTVAACGGFDPRQPLKQEEVRASAFKTQLSFGWVS